jgi:predicted nicotinamide N-methyase
LQDSELAQLMGRIEERYAVEVVPVKIGSKILRILQLRDFEKYIEEFVEAKEGSAMELPFWAKVWESTFVLSYFLGKQPVVLGRRMLELGAGVGVVGIYAALCGHHVTITDNNADALLFARANALLNGCPQVEVRKLDWRHTDLPHQYEVIFGSEIIYDRHSYGALVEFLRTTLTPTGVIFLSKNEQLPTPTFFPELTRHFKFKQTTQTLAGEGEATRIVLYAIRHKSA